MESMQPWGEKFNLPQQKPPQQQISLSREERLEAKRLAEEANFSFDGYQVVRREFISHRFDPAMTIRGNSIHRMSVTYCISSNGLNWSIRR